MSFVEKVEQLNQEIGATFDRAFSALRQEMRDRLRDSHHDLERGLEAFRPPLRRPFVAHEDLAPVADRLRAQARGAAFEELREAFAALDRARTQSEVLTALLAGACQVASRAALLLVRGGELRGWGGHGFAEAESALKELVLAPAGDSPWGRLARPAQDGEVGAAGASGTGEAGGTAGTAEAGGTAGAARLSAAECAVLCGRIETRMPAFGYLVPLTLRDRVVAALYADQSPAVAAAGGQDGQVDGLALPALQVLVYVAGLAIESLPFRQRAATATLAPASPAAPTAPATAADVAVAEPAAAGEPVAAEVGEAAAPVEPAAAAGLAAGEESAAVAEPEVGRPETATPASEAEAAEPLAEFAAAAPPETERGGEGSDGQAPAAVEMPAAAAASTSPAPVGDDTHPGVQAAGALHAVTPATLYDAPRAPAVKETAEIQLLRPLRPLPTLPPRPPLQAAPADSPSAVEGQEAPQDDGAAARVRAPDEIPAEGGAAVGTGGLDTQLLPHAANLRAVPPPAFSPGGMRQPAAAAASDASGGAAAATPQAPSPPPYPWSSPPPLSTSPAMPAAPASEPPRTAAIGTGTPEVRPPSGVQGPGWAFATARVQATSGEQALHEEARRLARLLVSEIKLYNEEQVEAGRRNRDIYERLREDIDRSRQMYEERIDPRLVKSTDYFYQELVRILGAGDASALGI